MKAILLRTVVPFFVLAIASSQVLAQLPPEPPSAEVRPQPAVAGEQLSVFVRTGELTCFFELSSSNVMVVGTQVIIDFEIATVGGPPVCGTPPPMFFESPIGVFSSGQYELVLNRTIDGVVDDPVIIPFGVLPPAVSVPIGRWVVPGLGLILLFFGWRRLRNN